jgi:large subunit ribosomal protein L25
MELKTEKRDGNNKGQNKAMRREGDIPAIIYSRGKEGKLVRVSGADFSAALRATKEGHLGTTKFKLSGEAGGITAIVKAIEYHPTTYAVLHLDLMELHDDVRVSVKVPIVFTGVASCAGIKLGGTLRQVLRKLPVNCLPKDLPTHFEIDVAEMGVKHSKRLSDITLPDGVCADVDVNEVAVVIAKR